VFNRLLIASLLLLGGCAAPSPVSNAPSTMAPASQAAATALVTDSKMGGTKQVSIAIAPPKDGAFRVQTVQHHWVADDIYQYTATLKVWDGSAYVDLATPLSVVVPQKGSSPKTMAVFTNLRQGKKYQIVLTAQGNDGGTAADTELNHNTASTAEFDFSASQDVEDTLSATMNVTFDAVAFSGSGSATITAPADGSYENPTSAESGAAQ
jgi:hypothetical protein